MCSGFLWLCFEVATWRPNNTSSAFQGKPRVCTVLWPSHWTKAYKVRGARANPPTGNTTLFACTECCNLFCSSMCEETGRLVPSRGLKLPLAWSGHGPFHLQVCPMNAVMTLPWLQRRSEVHILDLGSDSVLRYDLCSIVEPTFSIFQGFNKQKHSSCRSLGLEKDRDRLSTKLPVCSRPHAAIVTWNIMLSTLLKSLASSLVATVQTCKLKAYAVYYIDSKVSLNA